MVVAATASTTARAVAQVKLRDADPDPDQSILAPGKFDGQIIEISSK